MVSLYTIVRLEIKSNFANFHSLVFTLQPSAPKRVTDNGDTVVVLANAGRYLSSYFHFIETIAIVPSVTVPWHS